MAVPTLSYTQATAVVARHLPDDFDANAELLGLDTSTRAGMRRAARGARAALRGGPAKGFVGPRGDTPAGASEAAIRAANRVGQIVSDQLDKSFSPVPVVEGCRDRRTDGVLAKSPRVRVQVRRTLEDAEKPTKEEQDRIDVMDPALATWRTGRSTHRPLDALEDAVDSVTPFARGTLRLYVPPGRLRPFVGDDGSVVYRLRDAGKEGFGPADALRSIFVEYVPPDRACVATDEAGDEVGVVVLPTQEGALASRRYAQAEICTVDPDTGETVLRLVTDNAATPDSEIRMKLGGRLLHYDLRTRRAMIDEGVRRQQAALDTASTEVRVVNDEESFTETIVTNAMPPGEFVTVQGASGEDREVFVPDPTPRRPGATRYLQGEEIEETANAQGQVATDSEGRRAVRDVKNVGVTQLSPNAPDGLFGEMRQRRVAILDRFRQTFVEIAGEAAPSGEARQTSMWDFLTDAYRLKQRVDPAGEWMHAGAWALACHLAGVPEQDEDLEVEFACIVNVPAPTADHLRALKDLNQAGLRSDETTMAETGVDDPAAEVEAVQRDRERRRSEADALAVERQRVGIEADRKALDAEKTAIKGDPPPDPPNPPVPDA